MLNEASGICWLVNNELWRRTNCHLSRKGLADNLPLMGSHHYRPSASLSQSTLVWSRENCPWTMCTRYFSTTPWRIPPEVSASHHRRKRRCISISSKSDRRRALIFLLSPTGSYSLFFILFSHALCFPHYFYCLFAGCISLLSSYDWLILPVLSTLASLPLSTLPWAFLAIIHNPSALTRMIGNVKNTCAFGYRHLRWASRSAHLWRMEREGNSEKEREARLIQLVQSRNPREA